ncbi:transglycosylase SLT domain-containing protein [Nocardioides daeguensis]|uniref:Transglycosylase SLT domain-containing protein n=1 Tax=Nocardioides daeguensis TaxID=908359 RepID=A0ABP6WEJ1_9ACTN|nr:transglycosylase SLT domain-containing protein [Nocardioides daeguensis]MBV6727946.1 lytic transglycosylase domain-containing protein [Nocardioides daeguensis]MCR1774020.1 lytic transglycosylase domain-containing protein [Nocardioides daeguensis]
MGGGLRWAVAAALAAGALLLSACGSTPAPAAEPAVTTSATPTPSPRGVEPSRSGARVDVPTPEIMAALARRAERIAKRLPPVIVPTEVDPASNRGLGYRELIEFGFPADQWPYLDALWQRESGWNHLAENRSSGAYGIPQSLPGAKMAVVGSDWRTNPETQIRWGLAYIAARYGNVQKAWEHSERTGWY